MTALSPRQDAQTAARCRLISTGKLDGTGPRVVQSRYQRLALSAGRTLKAGPITLARLYPEGVPERLREVIPEISG